MNVTQYTPPRRAAAAAAAALTTTLALAAACWVVSIRQMNGMDMGTATRLGSFAFFIALWVPMMAAMMLPSAVPAVLRRVQTGGVPGVPLFVGGYLAVWTAIGVPVYVLDRPHSSVAAGVVVIGAGLYELTPLKARCRRRCRETTRLGEFALCCVGSSIGLMLVLVAVDVMSVALMSVIAVVVLAHKILPTKPAVDVPVALAIVALGLLIALAPATLAGPMTSM